MQPSDRKNAVYTKGRTSPRRSSHSDEPIFNAKKLLCQTIICIALLMASYISFYTEYPFCSKIKNEIRYTLFHTIDIKKAYRSAGEIGKYIVGAVEQAQIHIEPGKNPVEEKQ